jgi:hypothetical protein
MGATRRNSPRELEKQLDSVKFRKPEPEKEKYLGWKEKSYADYKIENEPEIRIFF